VPKNDPLCVLICTWWRDWPVQQRSVRLRARQALGGGRRPPPLQPRSQSHPLAQVLCEFYASWCPACKHFAPIYEQLCAFLAGVTLPRCLAPQRSPQLRGPHAPARVAALPSGAAAGTRAGPTSPAPSPQWPETVPCTRRLRRGRRAVRGHEHPGAARRSGGRRRGAAGPQLPRGPPRSPTPRCAWAARRTWRPSATPRWRASTRCVRPRCWRPGWASASTRAGQGGRVGRRGS
jgi:hypothetical protein